MRILIAGFDLFQSVGGGQTFYRGAIEKNPDIEFFYLRDKEPESAPRPANAHPLPYKAVYAPASLAGFAEPDVPGWLIHDFLTTNNIARAAAGRSFDVVDTPDYERYGHLMPGALARHGASAGKVVLSMHGAISTTLALNWGGTGTPMTYLVNLERLQYSAVDGRYFISPWYRDEWKGYSPLPAHDLDPMWIFTPPPRKAYSPNPGPPTLLLVGRTEKRKGPHLFVQMAWWLPADSFREAVVIGPAVTDTNGKSSNDYIRELAEMRKIGHRVRIEPTKTHDELAALYASNAVMVTPSVYDTLNLVAIESLFAGCPTVIGTGAGACQYLRERFPGLPFVECDLHQFYAQLPKVESVLREYDRHRDELAAALDKADLTPRTSPLADIYRAAPAFDAEARAESNWYDRKLGECLQVSR
jgi:glycosyltransferase involved in cell wall biosynthesis